MDKNTKIQFNRDNIAAWEEKANKLDAMSVVMISITEPPGGFLYTTIPQLGDKDKLINFLETVIEELKQGAGDFNPIV